MVHDDEEDPPAEPFEEWTPDGDASDSTGRPGEERGDDGPQNASAEQIVAANSKFYRALESLEIERMDDLWVHADWVCCVHPGWPMITGWTGVRESWQRIFENTETLQFEVTDVGVRIEHHTAWVTCNEEILHLSGSGVTAAHAVATNIWLDTSDGWRLVLHQASPVPDASRGEGGTEGKSSDAESEQPPNSEPPESE